MRCYPMTPEQIDLVRKSFDALWPFRRKLAEQFYGRFFELAPDTRRLFPSDMEKQQLKLMDTLAAIVGTLDHRDEPTHFQSIRHEAPPVRPGIGEHGRAAARRHPLGLGKTTRDFREELWHRLCP